MSYYRIIKNYQKLKLTLNIICHLTFNYDSCHRFSMPCHIFGENKCKNDMGEITSQNNVLGIITSVIQP